MRTKILFDDAVTKALEITSTFGQQLGQEVILIRDIRGKIRAVLMNSRDELAQGVLANFSQQLSEGLNVYGYEPRRSVLFADELSEDASAWVEKRLLAESEEQSIYLLDRQITGQDWSRPELTRETRNPRFTFYGIKGGVGRSTALIHWAWHLADSGKKVLIFDLDLESPGISSGLLPTESLPDFGIVDWFVENGVGQELLVEPEMVGLSPMSNGTSGEIRVVPAYGSKTGDYLPKLSRCYADIGAQGHASWAERLQQLVEALEVSVQPDVVIFDSRAGLHDIAAVLVTRMQADTFLFAVDSQQTWVGYGLLFKHWHSHPEVSNFRERLHVVAGMIPETQREEYLTSFREHAWTLFQEHLYEQAEAEDTDAFNFDLTDEQAPHSPIPVFWHRALQEFNPGGQGLDNHVSENAMQLFWQRADLLLAPT